MAIAKQAKSAKNNIKKVSTALKSKVSLQGKKAVAKVAKRARPGSKGSGDYYRIIIRPKELFVTFRTQDVGDPGGLQRVSGQRKSGSWSTQAWLVSKQDAHISKGHLVGDNKDAKNLISGLGSSPEHVEGDIFKAKDRVNIPEKQKPTVAQKKPRAKNIKKAQTTRLRSM